MLQSWNDRAPRRRVAGSILIAVAGLSLGACAQLAELDTRSRELAREPSPPVPVASEDTAPPRTVTVAAGDTLVGIARSEGISVEALVALNAIEDPSLIEVGRVLRVTDAPAPRAITPRPPPPRSTLETLALPFGITPEAAQLGVAVAAIPIALGALLVVVSSAISIVLGSVRALRRLSGSVLQRAGTRVDSTSGDEAAPLAPVIVFSTRTAVAAERTRPDSGAPAAERRARRLPAISLGSTAQYGGALRRAGTEVRRASSVAVARLLAGGVALLTRLRGATAPDGALGQRLRSGRTSLEQGLQDARLRQQGFAPGGAFWVRGSALMRLGTLDAAEAHYRTGLEASARQGWSLETARCLRQLARISESRGDLEQAREQLAEALALAMAHRDGATLAHELAASIAATADAATRSGAATSL